MKLGLVFILALFFCGCVGEQFFYAKNFRDTQNLQIPARINFDRYDTVALVAAGSAYEGKEIYFEVHRASDWRLIERTKPGILPAGKLAVNAFPNLASGHYHVLLFVSGKETRQFDITVAK